MTSLPAHVMETTETTRKFRCLACGARLILGEYHGDRERAEQMLTEWVQRHRHPKGPP